ncbi:MAG TPA: putative Fe-S cluster assembly protein SufT [bacterium]|nr:putative Fe-S cluster assembly protein SufT [bacterium]
MENSKIELSRDCEVTQIPSGNKFMLPKGTKVRITQSLGGSYTVMTDNGFMVRIEGENADSIGKEAAKPEETPAQGNLSKEDVEKAVWNQLRTCYDPEIPVNIVELGLVYECTVTEHPEGGFQVDVKMTLTAPGCGMGGPISAEAQSKIQKVPGVKQAKVELVWTPPWSANRMSDAAKLQLGMM